MTESPQTPDALLDAILPHVVFDGWSPASFDAACTDIGLTTEVAKDLAPRGALDLACAYHRRGDHAMVDAMQSADLSELRYSEKVAKALQLRVQAMGDRELIRRATTFFALPNNAVEGGKLVWETADHIWNVLGDTSEDGNWYSKRATLSGVWVSTVLFWLGDDSDGYEKTFDFIDRRIENVMQIEKTKAQLRKNPISKPLMEMQEAFFAKMRAPSATPTDLPGKWTR